jgi:peptidoglycan/xylan/chitin deacetylase (PgdA/CDA1 family)
VLHRFIELVEKYSIKPTLPVTAAVLDRHPDLFQKVQDKGVELAIHGHMHMDYTQLTPEEIRNHFKLAKDVFNRHGINYSGFRFPYLRRNKVAMDLLLEAGFQWDSSEVISWNLPNPDLFDPATLKVYQSILNSYEPDSADQMPALPEMRGKMVEIPVSVPDDDILVDRLGLRECSKMSEIWQYMARQVRDRGEVLVMQVHPERFLMYQKSLQNLLEVISGQDGAWSVTMGELAEWWKERNNFSFSVVEKSCECFIVKALCTKRATVLYKPEGVRVECIDPAEAEVMEQMTWEVAGKCRPVIGVSRRSSPELVRFLKEEGFCCEITGQQDKCSVFFDHQGIMDYEDKKRILKSIYQTVHPVIRFWRWPEQKRFVLAITGDIDGVNIWDFWRRFYG